MYLLPRNGIFASSIFSLKEIRYYNKVLMSLVLNPISFLCFRNHHGADSACILQAQSVMTPNFANRWPFQDATATLGREFRRENWKSCFSREGPGRSYIKNSRKRFGKFRNINSASCKQNQHSVLGQGSLTPGPRTGIGPHSRR